MRFALPILIIFVFVAAVAQQSGVTNTTTGGNGATVGKSTTGSEPLDKMLEEIGADKSSAQQAVKLLSEPKQTTNIEKRKKVDLIK